MPLQGGRSVRPQHRSREVDIKNLFVSVYQPADQHACGMGGLHMVETLHPVKGNLIIAYPFEDSGHSVRTSSHCLTTDSMSVTCFFPEQPERKKPAEITAASRTNFSIFTDFPKCINYLQIPGQIPSGTLQPGGTAFFLTLHREKRKHHGTRTPSS